MKIKILKIRDLILPITIFSFLKYFKIVFSTSPILCNFFNFTCRNSSKSPFQLWQQRKKQQLKKQLKRLQKRNNHLKLVLFFLIYVFIISLNFGRFYSDHPSFGNFIPKTRVVLSSESENFLIISQFSSIIF